MQSRLQPLAGEGVSTALVCAATRREPHDRPSHPACASRAAALGRGAVRAGRLLARGELPLGRADLLARQSPAARAPQAGARQAATAGALGDDTGAELRLCPPESADPRARSQRAV